MPTYEVDTGLDGNDCTIDADDEEAVLVEVALFRDSRACDEHPDGALGYARGRRWTAKLVNA